jgi:arylsulfatase A-like enzyme/tetratricopeptide (TPR) repeat protein
MRAHPRPPAAPPGIVIAFGALAVSAAALLPACGRAAGPAPSPSPVERPSILLVTLDTTRADAIGPEASGVDTPAFNALAARGRRFRQAYATAPETLPSHASMMTGLYPAGHGVHQNARPLAAAYPVLAEALRGAGYRTGAFVSSFVLARRFGLARGFDHYDDGLAAGRAERGAAETTERALGFIGGAAPQPVFLWVHYFDPHAPYLPPEPYRTRFAGRPYLGEVAAMDEQLGRLAAAFEQRAPGPVAIVIAADHGEGLGDHGETQHGNLLYQSTMRVPLLLVGPGVPSGAVDTPVSTRRVFHTVRDWAGLGAASSLRADAADVVLGEAMKPYLAYGWLPQVMAVEGRHKAIRAGTLEVYDVVADPGETRDLAASAGLSRELRNALLDYPVPSLQATTPTEALGVEERRQLASLGYVGAAAPPTVRRDAPRPVDMARLFDLQEKASGLFVREEYAAAVPLLQRILAGDPHNLDAALRLATAYSALGQDARAVAAFEKALAIAPQSDDVRTYLALHYARGADWPRAAPLLERIVAESPDRLPALEALAVIRQRQGRVEDAIALRQKIDALREPGAAELVALGGLAMQAGRTTLAIDSLEKARALQGAAFAHDLELGVLYLADRRFPEARDALDRVPETHRDYPMALFKRAQVSVLLQEPDKDARIARARQRADETTRPLIANERLFRP